MLLYPLAALLTPFSRTSIIKGNAKNGRNSPSDHFPVTAYINEEATGSINKETIVAIKEAAIDATKEPTNSLCFFI